MNSASAPCSYDLTFTIENLDLARVIIKGIAFLFPLPNLTVLYSYFSSFLMWFVQFHEHGNYNKNQPR